MLGIIHNLWGRAGFAAAVAAYLVCLGVPLLPVPASWRLILVSVVAVPCWAVLLAVFVRTRSRLLIVLHVVVLGVVMLVVEGALPRAPARGSPPENAVHWAALLPLACAGSVCFSFPVYLEVLVWRRLREGESARPRGSKGQYSLASLMEFVVAWAAILSTFAALFQAPPGGTAWMRPATFVAAWAIMAGIYCRRRYTTALAVHTILGMLPIMLWTSLLVTLMEGGGGGHGTNPLGEPVDPPLVSMALACFFATLFGLPFFLLALVGGPLRAAEVKRNGPPAVQPRQPIRVHAGHGGLLRLDDPDSGYARGGPHRRGHRHAGRRLVRALGGLRAARAADGLGHPLPVHLAHAGHGPAPGRAQR